MHNTAVERHWRGTNKITKKWKDEFKLLESFGSFKQGDYGDMYSLTAVYEDAVVADVDRHYECLRESKKSKSTLNPDFPGGLRRRRELYTDFEGFGTELSDGEIREVAEVGAAYAEVDDYHDWRWQVDPLQLRAAKKATRRGVRILSRIASSAS